MLKMQQGAARSRACCFLSRCHQQKKPEARIELLQVLMVKPKRTYATLIFFYEGFFAFFLHRGQGHNNNQYGGCYKQG